MQGATSKAVEARAQFARQAIIEEGSRHRITSHPSGRKVVLSERVTAESRGTDVPQWTVGPIPRLWGAWVIVEKGSRPHSILPRGMAAQIKRISARLASGKKLQRRQARIAAQLLTGDRAGLFAGRRPLGLGDNIGPRFVVQHPGHAPLGAPWARSLDRVGAEGRVVFEQSFRAELARRPRGSSR